MPVGVCWGAVPTRADSVSHFVSRDPSVPCCARRGVGGSFCTSLTAGSLTMMRREWDVKYQREVVALRTALAYPKGTTPYLQNKQVLADAIDTYPVVWRHAVDLDHAAREMRWFYRFARPKSLLAERLPLKVFRIFVRLGRMEINEDAATREISYFYGNHDQ